MEVARHEVAKRALVQSIGGERADRADPDGPCYDALVEFDRNRKAAVSAGNRWADVCALCDRAIDLTIPSGWRSLHLYLGPGWVHGGGREEIPVHHGCACLGAMDGTEPIYPGLLPRERLTDAVDDAERLTT